jgi:hypothetical protein
MTRINLLTLHGQPIGQIPTEASPVTDTTKQEPAAKPPYPFCSHPEKCCATGRCERRVGGELRCCAD